MRYFLNIDLRMEHLLLCLLSVCALLFHGYPVDWLIPFVTLLVLMVLWSGTKAEVYPVSFLHGAFFTTLVLLFFSYYWSGNPENSQITAWRLSAGVWCFFLLSHRECDKAVFLSIGLSALYAALLGQVEYWQTLARVTSVFLDPNVLSAVMYTASFVGLYYWFYLLYQSNYQAGKITIICFWSGQLLLLLTLFATDSRGGFISWGAGLTGLLLLNKITRSGNGRLLQQYVLIGFIAWLMVVVLPRVLGLDVPERIYGELATLHNRLPIWQASWQLFVDAPWLGNGLGTFYDLYPSVRTEMTTGGHHVHNDYLELLIEGGIVLLMLFCLWGSVHLFLLIKVLLRGKRAGRAGFALGILLCSNLMLFLHATVNFIAYVLWLNMVMGMVFALICRIAWREGYLKPPQWHTIPKVSTWCGGFVLLFISVQFLLTAIALYLFDSSRERAEWANRLSNDFSANAMILTISPRNQPATIDLMNRLRIAMDNTRDRQLKHKIFRQIWLMAQQLRTDAPFRARNHLIVAELIDYSQANDIPLHRDTETFDQVWEKTISLNPGYLPAHVVKAKRVEREDAEAALRLLQGVGQGWFQFAPEKQVQDYIQVLQNLLVRRSFQRDS